MKVGKKRRRLATALERNTSDDHNEELLSGQVVLSARQNTSERERETDRQTDRQRQKDRDRETNRDKERDRQTETRICMVTGREKERERGTERRRETEVDTERQKQKKKRKEKKLIFFLYVPSFLHASRQNTGANNNNIFELCVLATIYSVEAAISRFTQTKTNLMWRSSEIHKPLCAPPPPPLALYQ